MGGFKSLNENYPVAKKIAWRYGRVFLASFLGAISIDVVLNGSPDAIEAILKAGLIARVSSLFKYLREQANDYDATVHKLPL